MRMKRSNTFDLAQECAKVSPTRCMHFSSLSNENKMIFQEIISVILNKSLGRI